MPITETNIGITRDPDATLRQLLKNLVRRCSKSRAVIADDMMVQVGRKISERMLDDWIGPSKKPARFPAAFIEAFCEAVGNDALQRYVMSERLRDLVDLGERIRSMASVLGELQRLATKLTGGERQKKGLGKRPRKG